MTSTTADLPLSTTVRPPTESRAFAVLAAAAALAVALSALGGLLV
jgi:hypothetical protein